MTYSDDATPPATPPFGGETGDIFATSDPISGSPTTTERVVDTQSGYLVVLKKVDGTRVALSVKRRIGTPPGTSIVLTPDEQVKLSKILSEARSIPVTPATPEHRVSPRAEQFTNSLSSKTRSGSEEYFLGDEPEKEFARVSADREVDWALQKTGGNGFNRTQIIAIAAILCAVPVVIGFAASTFSHKTKPVQKPAVVSVAPQVSEEANVDRFIRGFVADMLDFDPNTYKVSQIRAMSQMKPELLERYWKETSFPLSSAQLQATPKGSTLMITKVTQNPGVDNTREVDLFAELVSANSKISTPVHLRLTVGHGADNQLRVLEQKDLSNANAK